MQASEQSTKLKALQSGSVLVPPEKRDAAEKVIRPFEHCPLSHLPLYLRPQAESAFALSTKSAMAQTSIFLCRLSQMEWRSGPKESVFLRIFGKMPFIHQICLLGQVCSLPRERHL